MSLFWRDIKLAMRSGGGALLGVLFFLAVIAVVPFAVGPDLNFLQRIGPAMLWIGALLSTLLGLDRLFQAERDDGSLNLSSTLIAPSQSINKKSSILLKNSD